MSVVKRARYEYSASRILWYVRQCGTDLRTEHLCDFRRRIFKAKLTAKKFTQLYGISNFDGMQESEVTFSLAMKNEKEIYLMSEKQDDDDKVTYQLQAGKIG